MAKTLVGTVVSDKNDKTIIVKVVTHKTHPIYKKQYIESKRFKAHDGKNEAKLGDKVSIIETRPVSAQKSFSLKQIIERPLLTEENIVTDEKVIEEITQATEAKPAKKTVKSANSDPKGEA